LTPPLRGREGELALICGLLAAAGRGEGSFVVLEDPAGFGKTRLLQAAVEQATAAGLRPGYSVLVLRSADARTR
jgi:hypothetical protein